jgi:hypothetical protein
MGGLGGESDWDIGSRLPSRTIALSTSGQELAQPLQPNPTRKHLLVPLPGLITELGEEQPVFSQTIQHGW